MEPKQTEMQSRAAVTENIPAVSIGGGAAVDGEKRSQQGWEAGEGVFILLLRAELFSSAPSLAAPFYPKGKLPHLFPRRVNLIWLNEATSVISAACEVHVMVGRMCMSACTVSLQSHRDGCVIGCTQDDKMHIKGTYCAFTVARWWDSPILCC